MTADRVTARGALQLPYTSNPEPSKSNVALPWVKKVIMVMCRCDFMQQRHKSSRDVIQGKHYGYALLGQKRHDGYVKRLLNK